MSRRPIDTPDDAAWDIVVGWDPPLQTYYGQVMPLGDISDDDLLLWVGRSPGELLTVPALDAALGAWATIDAELWNELERDRETNS